MPSFEVDGEYVFARLIFNSAINESRVRNTAWRDWPESDYHLIDGIGRLSVIINHNTDLGDAWQLPMNHISQSR